MSEKHKNKLMIFALSLIVIALATIGLASIRRASTGQAKIKIGFLLSTLQEERYAKDKQFFESRVNELGDEVVFASANNNEEEQLSKVKNLLSQGIKVLVVQPVNSKAASIFVDLAHKDAVKVIAYDRIINNAAVDLYVTHDFYQVGVLQAQAAVQFTQGRGNYVVLQGEAGHNVANQITRGVKDTLKKYPAIYIVVSQSHVGWSSDLAMKTVENALMRYGNNVQAILANNSDMANGAVQALAKQKLTGEVFVAGGDADLTSMKNIVAGRQQFEVLKALQPLAYAAAESAVALAKNESASIQGLMDAGAGFKIPFINTPVYPVTKDNLDSQVVATGFHSHQEVYGN